MSSSRVQTGHHILRTAPVLPISIHEGIYIVAANPRRTTSIDKQQQSKPGTSPTRSSRRWCRTRKKAIISPPPPSLYMVPVIWNAAYPDYPAILYPGWVTAFGNSGHARAMPLVR